MISWNDNLSTGIRVIDDDHKFLIGLINTFEKLSSDRSDATRISSSIDALSDYAKNHFRREELLMMAAGYSDRVEHHAEHESFCRIADSLANLYGLCPTLVNLTGVSDFLSSWLIKHIAVSDRAYIAKLRDNLTLINALANNLNNDLNFTL